MLAFKEILQEVLEDNTSAKPKTVNNLTEKDIDEFQ
jgi:hypothetical protein